MGVNRMCRPEMEKLQQQIDKDQKFISHSLFWMAVLFSISAGLQVINLISMALK